VAVFAAGSAGGSFRAWKIEVASALRLAAAPTLLLMGGISAFGSPGMTICTTAVSLSPIGDMALMYLLMGVFHLSPWLQLLAAHSRRQIEGD